MLDLVTANRDEWTKPGAFEVAPGVFRIPLPMPSDGLRAVNVYAIEDGRGLTLIDGGWAVAPARRDLELALKQLGATPRSITRILVTHSHRDHYTMAVALRRDFGTPIALGIGERPSLEAAIDRIFNFGPQMSALRESGAEELARTIEAEDVRVDPARQLRCAGAPVLQRVGQRGGRARVRPWHSGRSRRGRIGAAGPRRPGRRGEPGSR